MKYLRINPQVLYFKYGIKGSEISGSYSEGISPADVNDKDIFARRYF